MSNLFDDIGSDIRNIQNAMRPRDAAQRAAEQERSVGLFVFVLLLFGGPLAAAAFGVGAAIWALVVILLVLIGRRALDFVNDLIFGFEYGPLVDKLLTLLPVMGLYSLPVAFGGRQLGMGLVESIGAALIVPLVIFIALKIRERATPMQDYIRRVQGWE